MPTTTIILTGSGTWSIPADWNDSDNTIELIGSGGNGFSGTAAQGSPGGGGGAYTKVTNVPIVSLIAGGFVTSLDYNGLSPSKTYFLLDSDGNQLLFSNSGGSIAFGIGGGTGGTAASTQIINAIDYLTTARSGGNGGDGRTSSTAGGGGGGGAGGPNGNGAAGGSNTATAGGFGRGGGGGNGGTAGSSTNTTAGTAGTGAGAGGAGGAGFTAGTAGGAGTSAYSGGGGGGGGDGAGGNGGAGGAYGAGGGGGGSTVSSVGGARGSGVIVIKYTPLLTPTPVSRLISTGTLLVNGSFDENTSISPSIFRTTANTVYAGSLDEVTYNPASTTANGGRYNLSSYSNYFAFDGTLGWNNIFPAGATLTTGIDAPDGSSMAVRWSCNNTTNALLRVYLTSFIPNGSSTYTMSFYARHVSGTKTGCTSDLADGVGYTYSTVLVTGSWVRITYSGIPTATGKSFLDLFSDANTNNVIDYWGVQIQQASSVSIYQPIYNNLVTPPFTKREGSDGTLYVTNQFDEYTGAP